MQTKKQRGGGLCKKNSGEEDFIIFFFQRGGRFDSAGGENLSEGDLPQGETFLMKVKVSHLNESEKSKL